MIYIVHLGKYLVVTTRLEDLCSAVIILLVNSIVYALAAERPAHMVTLFTSQPSLVVTCLIVLAAVAPFLLAPPFWMHENVLRNSIYLSCAQYFSSNSGVLLYLAAL